jgi:hypothetical protein
MSSSQAKPMKLGDGTYHSTQTMHHESVVIHLIHKYAMVLKLSLDELKRISDDIDNKLQQTSIMLVVSWILKSNNQGEKSQPILEKVVIDMKMGNGGPYNPTRSKSCSTIK